MMHEFFKEWADDNGLSHQYFSPDLKEDKRVFVPIRERFYDAVGRTKPNIDMGLSKSAINSIEYFIDGERHSL
jgi:hypothetical protein